MTKCNASSLDFPAQKGRKVEINFEGGNVSSDGGILLLSQIDQKLGLTQKVAQQFEDGRDQSKVKHSLLSMLRQRVYGIALGYEDLNDHNDLRFDPAFQTAVHTDSALASSPTLCRLENKADRGLAVAIHQVLIDQFINSYKSAPNEIILDFDATDDLIHGEQVGRFYHGYYGNYCFLPLYVFCGTQLLVSYLRSSNQDAALHAGAILSLLVKRLRQAWPDVKIIFRGDSGFCRPRTLEWCDRDGVFYIVGIARNKKLERQLAPTLKKAKKAFVKTQEKQRIFTEFQYAAKSWKRKRRLIGKAEVTARGSNPRFIVTNLTGKPQALYDKVYCARGNMENRIKEVQLELFADRTSCHEWWPNQLRLLLSSLAYVLIERLRAVALRKTHLATAQVHTIRLKLLKIGAVILKNTRRIRFMLSSHYPFKNLFRHVAFKLRPT
jgi:hypothetical protein